MSYLQRSSELYCDVEGKSRRVLIATCMALLVDGWACRQFPLLSEHHLGVDITILSRLLLPLERHRRLLHDMEVYVKARDQQAQYPSTIRPVVQRDSFSVRYHDTSTEMMDVRQKIFVECQSNRQKKQLEVEEKLSKHQELQISAKEKALQADGMTCQYVNS